MRRALALTGLALFVAPFAAPAARAQVATQKSLTLDGARRVIAAAEGAARDRGAGGVIAVVDAGGNLMAVERIDGTFAAGANVAIGKARTAVLFKKPTRFFEDVINKGRTAMTTLADFTPLQGGVPIVVDSQIVGAVGVSGANSAAQDDSVATVASIAMQRTGAGSHATATDRDGVAFFDHRQVAAAFAKGAVLLDGTGRNYMVHASRREQAGQAEVHVLDTDVIYVLGGGATLVTGGKLVEGKETEPGEERGAAIEGGDVRQLAKGDVITVPSGTPHWFREIKGPLTYYVVKVR